MQPKQTLLLAPSERLNWIGLQITLKRWREVRVQSVRQAAEAVALATVQPQPAAILVAADVVSPPLLALVRSLRSTAPASKIVVVGESRDPLEHERLRCLGTTAYLEWAELHPEVVQPVLVTILRSNFLVWTSGGLERLLEAPVMERRRRPRDASLVLDAQERAVLTRVGSGLLQREIAAEMHLGVATVERIVARLRAKFGVSSTCALCAQAGRLGFFD